MAVGGGGCGQSGTGRDSSNSSHAGGDNESSSGHGPPSSVRVTQVGKRPYWAGELVGMNESLQKLGQAIGGFSEALRSLERTARIATL